MPGDNGTSGHDCFRTDRYSWANKGLRPNPRAIANDDGPVPIRKVWLGVVMVAGAKKDALGNAAVRPNCDRLEIKNEHFLADPGMVTDFELPWEMDIDAGFDYDPAANPSAAPTKDGTFDG